MVPFQWLMSLRLLAGQLYFILLSYPHLYGPEIPTHLELLVLMFFNSSLHDVATVRAPFPIPKPAQKSHV